MRANATHVTSAFDKTKAEFTFVSVGADVEFEVITASVPLAVMYHACRKFICDVMKVADSETAMADYDFLHMEPEEFFADKKARKYGEHNEDFVPTTDGEIKIPEDGFLE
jgi:hypothetical protein